MFDTGPLYFIIKLSVPLNFATIKEKFSDLDFVPILMASEDHDYEEISSFIFKGKSFNGGVLRGAS